MDQETRWMVRYNEVVEFLKQNHRNPSKHRIEEHDMLNWVKHQRKLMNAGELKDSDFYAYEDTKEVVIRAYLTDVVEDCAVARMPGYISNDGKMVLQYKAWYENGKVEYQFYCGKSDNIEDLKECAGPFYRKYLNIKYIGSRRDFWGYINKSKKDLLNQAKLKRSEEEQVADDSLYTKKGTF